MAKEFFGRKSIRLPGFDYGQDAYYLFTLVTADRVKWLARVRDGELKLTQSGEVVEEEWLRTGRLREHVHLDAFVIMPEHVHGIFRFGNPELSDSGASMKQFDFNTEVTFSHPVNKLGSTIKGFKGACTRGIRKHHPEFKWVRNYWERVIRSQEELKIYRTYIKENPAKLLSLWRQGEA